MTDGLGSAAATLFVPAVESAETLVDGLADSNEGLVATAGGADSCDDGSDGAAAEIPGS